MSAPLLELQGLVQTFTQRRYSGKGVVRALNGVDLTLNRGETLGIVGETGCGKSTLCKAVLRLVRPQQGRIVFDGVDLARLGERELRPLRRRLQMVFQDPADSLNPRLTVGDIIEEPLVIHRSPGGPARRQAGLDLLAQVGLGPDAYNRYPHEFSGGQKQRVAIARALALGPDLLVCDEPVSALDVSVQAQILNLLLDLQAQRGLSLLFVSHNLAVVRHMADRVAVLYLGSVMEVAGAQAIYAEPRHPYTAALIASIPRGEPGRRPEPVVRGEVPSPLAPPSGCPFRLACPLATDLCAREKPALRELGPGHQVACHYA